jgi:hypothetical protein
VRAEGAHVHEDAVVGDGAKSSSPLRWLSAIGGGCYATRGLHYWEVAIDATSCGAVLVGVTLAQPGSERAVQAASSGRGLWTMPIAWALHVGSGNCYTDGHTTLIPSRGAAAVSLAYARPLSSAAGSRVGVLLELRRYGASRLSFFDNGRPLGLAFDDLPPGPLYPLVELCHARDTVTLHSGPDVEMPTERTPAGGSMAGLALASNAAPALAMMRLPPPPQ